VHRQRATKVWLSHLGWGVATSFAGCLPPGLLCARLCANHLYLFLLPWTTLKGRFYYSPCFIADLGDFMSSGLWVICLSKPQLPCAASKWQSWDLSLTGHIAWVFWGYRHSLTSSSQCRSTSNCFMRPKRLKNSYRTQRSSKFIFKASITLTPQTVQRKKPKVKCFVLFMNSEQ
jgi:hypothetical protein